MKLIKDYIVTLENGEKYIVVNDGEHEGVKYFLLMGVTDNEQDVDASKMLVVEEKIVDGESYAKVVTDQDLIITLVRILKPTE